jgi:antitoxin component YwqK of YwqJK toxin-antitoxin module
MLQELLEICKPYTDDEKYVYKKCCDVLRKDKSRKWLVILEKTDETKTNEGRSGIMNPDTAQYRASVLKVVRIINLNDPKKTIKYLVNQYPGPDSGYHCNFVHQTKYTVGKKVEATFNDDDNDNLCFSGIYYFKSIEPAILYRVPPRKYFGTMIRWYSDGALLAQGEVAGAERVMFSSAVYEEIKKGTWTEWYENGKKRVVGHYDEKGYATGTWTKYYQSGQVQLEGSFEDDHKIGIWTLWNQNTQGDAMSVSTKEHFDKDWWYFGFDYDNYTEGPLSYKISECALSDALASVSKN